MINLQTIGNSTYMSHIDKPVYFHVLFDSHIVIYINLFISSFCNTLR